VQAHILNLLAYIHTTTGTALLFVTHNLLAARQLCEHGIVMRAGEIIERGPLDRLLTSPDHPYTQSLLNSLPRPSWLRRAQRAPSQ
jgi:ABC-type dipeptide/oligopeptide/nickel transport system ATPase component